MLAFVGKDDLGSLEKLRLGESNDCLTAVKQER